MPTEAHSRVPSPLRPYWNQRLALIVQLQQGPGPLALAMANPTATVVKNSQGRLPKNLERPVACRKIIHQWYHDRTLFYDDRAYRDDGAYDVCGVLIYRDSCYARVSSVQCTAV